MFPWNWVFIFLVILFLLGSFFLGGFNLYFNMSSKDEIQALKSRVLALETASLRTQGQLVHTIVAGGMFTAAGSITIDWIHNTQTRTVQFSKITVTGATMAAAGQPGSYSLSTAIMALPPPPNSAYASGQMTLVIGGVQTRCLALLTATTLFLQLTATNAVAGDPVSLYTTVTAALDGDAVVTAVPGLINYDY